MIEHYRFQPELSTEFEAAMRATILYSDLIFRDQTFRENLPASSQLITLRENTKQAMYRARTDARAYVRTGATAVVFDPTTLTAYVYEPDQPLRVLRGTP